MGAGIEGPRRGGISRGVYRSRAQGALARAVVRCRVANERASLGSPRKKCRRSSQNACIPIESRSTHRSALRCVYLQGRCNWMFSACNKPEALYSIVLSAPNKLIVNVSILPGSPLSDTSTLYLPFVPLNSAVPANVVACAVLPLNTPGISTWSNDTSFAPPVGSAGPVSDTVIGSSPNTVARTTNAWPLKLEGVAVPVPPPVFFPADATGALQSPTNPNSPTSTRLANKKPTLTYFDSAPPCLPHRKVTCAYKGRVERFGSEFRYFWLFQCEIVTPTSQQPELLEENRASAESALRSADVRRSLRTLIDSPAIDSSTKNEAVKGNRIIWQRTEHLPS